MAPTISVVMPAYNAGTHISEAISSVLSQTFHDFEFIIVDDGSSDDTAEIAQRFGRLDSRIVVLTKENGGIVSALNHGLAHCNGRFVVRMDADDVSAPERFAIQLAEFERDSSLVLCGSHARFFGSQNRLQPMPLSDAAIRSSMPFYVPFIHPTVMYRLTPETRTLRYKEEFRDAEDYALWIELAKLGRMKNINRALLHYRTHDSQVSVTRRSNQRSVHLRLSEEQLVALGIRLSERQLSAFIFPGDSGWPKRELFLNWAAINSRLIAAGRTSPYLLLKSLAKTLMG